MFAEVLLSTAIFIASYLLYHKISGMRPVDRDSLIHGFVLKSGFIRIFATFDMRPKTTEITTEGGKKFIAQHPAFVHTIDLIPKFEVRKNDIFVATYPKAGTTWMQEIVWLICNNCDTNSAKAKSVLHRYGLIEVADTNSKFGLGFQGLERWPLDRQRFIKTHLRFELLPEEVVSGRKGKIVYVARNPKDVCVSYFHFHHMNKTMPSPGNWDEFLSNFCSGKLSWGDWFEHTLSYWQKYRERKDQIYFVTYEDLKTNLRAELDSLARFLEKDLSSSQLDTISQHCSFECMSKNPKANFSVVQQYGLDFKISKFMRKGVVGDWKNHFTLNQNQAFDELYEEKMKGSELHLKFQL